MNNIFIKKYKPKNLHEFGLNTEFLNLLQTSSKTDNINILLVGQPGSGKTSIIDTLINDYYSSYSEHEYSGNILHINNLKDQGINYYRNDVKNFCQTTSSLSGKKKYVVLDDIDFMNEQSQQVFRNTIDKYQSKVNFVASCTNIQKVIDSIQSRFIIVNIQSVQKAGLYKLFKKVIENEGIIIQEETINFVIELCNLSIKAMLNYLEKFKLINEEITFEIAVKTCTNIGFNIFEDYVYKTKSNQVHDAIMILYQLHDNGYSVLDILDTFFMFVKITDIFTEHEKYKIIPILCKYISAFHDIHENEIELALFTNNIHTSLSTS
tara:strand:- start:24249 stop:25214 length:966 start_codon:yes stop_codon:yes gene_type:complete